MQALLETSVSIEAGVGLSDAELLVGCGLAGRVTRVMIEPVEVSRPDAVLLVDAIHDVLDRAGVPARRLQHGDGEATWILIEDAIRRGTTPAPASKTPSCGPMERAASNAELVQAARDLGAWRQHRTPRSGTGALTWATGVTRGPRGLRLLLSGDMIRRVRWFRAA